MQAAAKFKKLSWWNCCQFGILVNIFKGRPGALPLDPDGVPPPALALRGGSFLYCSCGAVNLACCRAADANLGTDKMGSGAYGPSGSRAEPWPSLHRSNGR